jgi:uncharacterized membrane protein
MSYEDTISSVVKGTEAVGAAIMVVGGLATLGLFVRDVVRGKAPGAAYRALRRNLGRCILLGLEVLIVADIVRTIIVDTSFESVAVLGVIVLIRIVLSFSLEVEMDGTWPWRRDERDGSGSSAADGT